MSVYVIEHRKFESTKKYSFSYSIHHSISSYTSNEEKISNISASELNSLCNQIICFLGNKKNIKQIFFIEEGMVPEGYEARLVIEQKINGGAS